jgi:hypothetical protein
VADIFTKPLPAELFNKFKKLLGMQAMVQVSSQLEFSRENCDSFNRDRSDLTGLFSFLFFIFITNSRVFF